MLKANQSECKHDFVCSEGSNEISYCNNCSCLSFKSSKAIKPNCFDVKCDISLNMYQYKDSIVKFYNKAEYIKVRSQGIQTIKEISLTYSLSLSTVFLAVAYLDNICSKMSNFTEINSIAKICLILSAKFSSEGFKGYQIEKDHRDHISTSYRTDEMFIVKLLDYNLNIYTTYNILTLLLSGGIVFDNEKVNKKKMAFAYFSVMKTALAFLENKLSLNLTQSQIALGIIGFARKMIGLEAFCPALKVAYHLETIENFCLEGLKKISKCFRVKKSDQLEKRMKSNYSKGGLNCYYKGNSSESNGDIVIIS